MNLPGYAHGNVHVLFDWEPTYSISSGKTDFHFHAPVTTIPGSSFSLDNLYVDGPLTVAGTLSVGNLHAWSGSELVFTGTSRVTVSESFDLQGTLWVPDTINLSDLCLDPDELAAMAYYNNGCLYVNKDAGSELRDAFLAACEQGYAEPATFVIPEGNIINLLNTSVIIPGNLTVFAIGSGIRLIGESFGVGGELICSNFIMSDDSSLWIGEGGSMYVERDFQEVLDRAMEGADFGPREGDDEDDVAAGIAGLITLLIAYLSVRKVYRKFTGKVSRRDKRKILGMSPNAVGWSREIPFGGDLVAADYTLTRLGEDRKKNALASAEILRMIYTGLMDVRKDADGKVEITFSKKGGEGIDSVGLDLKSMMVEASGEDAVLQDKEFSAWSKQNARRLYNWTDKIQVMGESTLRQKNWMVGSRFTTAGQKEARGLLGFRKFLEDFTLTGERKYMSLRAALLNPSVIFVALGFVLYLLNARPRMPVILTGGIATVASMSTPLSMFILGVRLGAMRPRDLVSDPVVWGIAAGKLLLFPLFGYLLVAFLPLPEVFRGSILILSAAPCASILLNLAEIHENGRELAAACALLTTLLSIVTIPLLSFLL